MYKNSQNLQNPKKYLYFDWKCIVWNHWRDDFGYENGNLSMDLNQKPNVVKDFAPQTIIYFVAANFWSVTSRWHAISQAHTRKFSPPLLQRNWKHHKWLVTQPKFVHCTHRATVQTPWKHRWSQLSKISDYQQPRSWSTGSEKWWC